MQKKSQALTVNNKKSGHISKGTVTVKDDMSMQYYLKEVAKYESLDKDTERELIEDYLINGNERSKDRVIKANLRFVVSASKMYQGKGLNLGDLINEGNYGLLKAIEKFDLNKDIKFLTYAVWWVKQSINQAISESSKGIKLPANRSDSIHRLMKIENDLETQLGRVPTNEEVMNHKLASKVRGHKMKLTEESLKELNSYRVQQLSIDDTLSSSDEHTTYIDVIESDAILLEPQQVSFEKDLKKLMSVLTPQEANILKFSYGVMVKEKKDLTDIAEMYSLSKERVRQIRDKAIRKLRDNPNVTLLLEYIH